MRKLNALIAGLVLVFSGMSAEVWAMPKLEALWVTSGLKVPASAVVYRDPKSTFLLVSQINGDPHAVDGNGAIAKLTMGGELDNAEWVKGLNAPSGMAIFDGKLYVADINQLVIINIKKADIEQRIPVSGAVALTDVSVDSQGSVYISDSKTNKIHRYAKGVVEDYLLKVDSAGGLRAIARNLVVGSGTKLLLLDRDRNRLQLASGFSQAIVGVDTINQTDFIVSCLQGLIYYVHLDGKLDVLLDSQAQQISTADISYDEATQTLFVPNYSKNTLSAYKITGR